MAFDELKTNVDKLQVETKAYVESSVAYYKLWGFKVAMKSTTMIFKFVLIALFSLMVLLFGSIALAITIGNALESQVLGFLCVAGIYLVFVILLFFIKYEIVEGRILRKFSEIFFND